MSHSPGPWRWSSGFFRLEAHGGAPIIGINRANGGMYMPGEADARLIAAAPELLQQLKALVQTVNRLAEDVAKHANDVPNYIVAYPARALIARIEGEECKP